MRERGMNRRQFLQASGITAAGVAATAAGGILIDPKGAWAMSLAALDPHGAATLVAMSRMLYPHDRLAEVYYAKVVESLDQKAAADKALAGLLNDGVATLDRAYGVAWLNLSDGYKTSAIKSVEKTPFFQTVRFETIVVLYNNPAVWRHFGYEGASADFGGYIERGFNDIGWLKDS